MFHKLKNIVKNKDLMTKLLTFLFAFFIWLFIYNYNDPVVIENYSLNVNLLNEDILKSASKVYNITQGKTVSVKIKAKQSFFDEINKENIIATADLSNLSEVNATSININIENSNSNDWEVVDIYPSLLKVNIDEYISEQYLVEIDNIGDLSEDKYLKDFSCSPSMITISGPKSIMSNIYKVFVEPNLTLAEEGYNTNCDVKIINENGEDITSEYNLDTSKIKVYATILSKKEVPVNINIIDNVPIGYEILSTSFNPTTVLIAGDKQTIKNLNEININYTINQIDNIEKTLNIEDYVSNNVLILNNKEIIFSAEISAFSTKSFEISKEDIVIKNLKENMKVSNIVLLDNTFEITGPTNELENISKKNFEIYVDAENLNSGEINVSCNIISDEKFKDIQILSVPNIKINLKKK